MNAMYVPEQSQVSKAVCIIQPGILLQAHGGDRSVSALITVTTAVAVPAAVPAAAAAAARNTIIGVC